MFHRRRYPGTARFRNYSAMNAQHLAECPPMTRSGGSARLGGVSLAVGQIYALDVEPTVKARMLRELAVWYRALAEQAANPVIWESRLLTAKDLDAAAGELEQERAAALGAEKNSARFVCKPGSAPVDTASFPSVTDSVESSDEPTQDQNCLR